MMKLSGLPIKLDTYETLEIETNKYFSSFTMPEFERVYLPDSMRPFTNIPPTGAEKFIVDDNRSAISPSPYVTLDGTDFYLSVKGIGSVTNPFSRKLLDRTEVCNLLKDSNLRERITNFETKSPRYITSELWQRWSPYGGQGLQHAALAMRASEMFDMTSINGFRIAPLVKIVFLPRYLEQEIKKLYWYRKFPGRIVQETRLVPSNIRVYFHSGSTIGSNISAIFDYFDIDTNEIALAFLNNLIKSSMAFLTLFVRSLKHNDDGTWSGFDFYDVWLDKDAVLAPDGTVYFVDLEGLEWVTIEERDVQEKIYHQVYRSLYEFMYAYQQIEQEREARFELTPDRKVQFEYLLREALKGDKVLDLEKNSDGLKLVVNNILGIEKFVERFTMLDYESERLK